MPTPPLSELSYCPLSGRVEPCVESCPLWMGDENQCALKSIACSLGYILDELRCIEQIFEQESKKERR
jgi:hypothetical protein